MEIDRIIDSVIKARRLIKSPYFWEYDIIGIISNCTLARKNDIEQKWAVREIIIETIKKYICLILEQKNLMF